MILREAPHRDGTISCDALQYILLQCAHVYSKISIDASMCIDPVLEICKSAIDHFPTNFHLADQANLKYHFNEMTINNLQSVQSSKNS